MKKKILVVDDERSIREVVKDILENEGYHVLIGINSEEAIRKSIALVPDLIILDLGIPTIGGLEVCRILRKETNTMTIPIIILTARSREVDKIIGLEMGADDYVTKPFNKGEFVARVKAVLRRVKYKENEDDVLRICNITIDKVAHIVEVKEKKIDLRPKEFHLLYLLMKKAGTVLSRDYLCESILGYEYFGSSRAIDAHVKNLRKTLGKEGDIIKTIRSVGYKMEVEES